MNVGEFIASIVTNPSKTFILLTKKRTIWMYLAIEFFLLCVFAYFRPPPRVDPNNLPPMEIYVGLAARISQAVYMISMAYLSLGVLQYVIETILITLVFSMLLKVIYQKNNFLSLLVIFGFIRLVTIPLIDLRTLFFYQNSLVGNSIVGTVLLWRVYLEIIALSKLFTLSKISALVLEVVVIVILSFLLLSTIFFLTILSFVS